MPREPWLDSLRPPADFASVAQLVAWLWRRRPEPVLPALREGSPADFASVVQPVAWLLDHDVREGKRELNFSEFGAYPAQRAAHKLAAIGKEVGEGDMPLSSYAWMHPAARLTPEQRSKLVDWAQALHDELPPEPADTAR